MPQTNTFKILQQPFTPLCKRLFALLLLSTFQFSCEDVVQVKLDEGSTLYVVDAFLQSKYDIQSIRITTSSSYFGDNTPQPVISAKGKLSDLSTGAEYPLYHQGKGKYQIVGQKDLMFVVGHHYQLEVEIDGILYKAGTVLCRPAKIESISYEYYAGGSSFGQVFHPYYLCRLWAKDKADQHPDYYWLKTFLHHDTLTNISVCIDGTNGPVTNANSDSIYFAPPFSYLNFQRYSPGGICSVEINAITHETYDFLRQAGEQIQNGGLFAKTPENVKTNFITPQGAKYKMVGWFSVASAVDTNIHLP